MMINLRVSDLKQYFYCPRIIYYTYCLPVPRPITHPMEIGAVEHEVLSVFERRRGLKKYGLEQGERKFHVSLQAPNLGLTGVLDMIIITQENAFPVEIKHTSQPVNINAKCQLTAYAMMLEEFSGKPVEYGFIYRIIKQNVTTVPISQSLRQKTLKGIADMKELIIQEIMPEPPRQRGKCIECEFRRYCRDVT